MSIGKNILRARIAASKEEIEKIFFAIVRGQQINIDKAISVRENQR